MAVNDSADPVLRLRRMEKLARFTAMTGERREPEYPHVSEAAHRGDLGPGHVNAVIEVLTKLPHALPHDTKLAAEQTMAEISVELTPAEIVTAGGRLLAHLDPDGELTDDRDRKRQRNLWLNRQDAQTDTARQRRHTSDQLDSWAWCADVPPVGSTRVRRRTPVRASWRIWRMTLR